MIGFESCGVILHVVNVESKSSWIVLSSVTGHNASKARAVLSSGLLIEVFLILFIFKVRTRHYKSDLKS